MKKQNNIDCLYSKGEIKINPDIKFYDVEQSKLNPFTGDDYNKINASVKASLAKKLLNRL
jgi:hypothetical protein